MSGVLLCTSWPMEKNKMYTTDAVSLLVLLSKLTPQKQCGKPDYKKKGIGRNIPNISCCILLFFKYYMHMLQASCICYNPEGWCKKRKRQDHIATVLHCGKNTVHELSLVGSQIPAPKELWLLVLHLLCNFSQVRVSTDHVLTGVPFWQLFRCNKD